MEKIWLKHYPKGVPAEIDINEYQSVRDVFEESVAQFAARPAFNCMGRTITFAGLDTLSRAFGAWLQANGCIKGTRVAAEACILYSHYNEWALQQPNQPNKHFSLREHVQLIYNALHDKEFRSIGCAPCTRAVAQQEDLRAGRWWWETPEHKECGLHNRPRKG